ncbi:marine proteobacterial sortase target protein [Halioxenophilus aromaticivorans]|uniref:Marine proteobacterial sortase target protein n=2 Tax=Halioxenophilus aromaticivorans TaxID=1306992 RepID=A0AAV3U3E5_9ALTE
MLWRTDDSYQQAILLDTAWDIDISGPLATVVLTQTFENTGSDWREGIYVFPLSEKSTVHYLAITTADRKIVAQVKEKALAKKIYTRAKSQGKKAALLEQVSGNLFRQAVANIAPYEKVTVEIHLQIALDYQHPTFSLSLPTTFTPRFSPAELIDPNNTPDTLATHQPELKSGDTDGSYMSVDITLDAALAKNNIRSSHEINTIYDGDSYSVNTVQNSVLMDRDFILQWDLPVGSEPQSALYQEQIGTQRFGLLMVTPPAGPSTALAQDIIFIIDTSGSMGGASIQQAKQALAKAVEQLSPDDSFNILQFNDDFEALFANSVPANSSNVAQGLDFIQQLEAEGGTQMLPVLMQALATPKADENTLRQVVFITDGAIGYEQDLLNLIYHQLDDARLFTVAIGSAPNDFFMRKAAQVGRGSFTKISDVNQVADQVAGLFNKLNHAVMQKLHITWPQPVEAWPKETPDLYADEPIIVAVKFTEDTPLAGDIQLQGNYSDGSLWQGVVPRGNDQAQRTGIARQWARHKIDHLLDQVYLGVDEATVKTAVVPLAEQHQLLTPYTSFVAVEETIHRPASLALTQEKIAATAPNQDMAIPAPQTATYSTPLAALGCLLLLIAAAYRRVAVAKRWS